MWVPAGAPAHRPAAAIPAGSTVLGVWAHPDDEAFVAAGTMAAAAARGCRVVSVYASRGEQGWQSTTERRPADLGALRSGELAVALRALGADHPRFLDYPDGGLAAVPISDAVTRLHAVLDEVDPDVVLTFGPDGFTGHPDHVAVSGWVTSALQMREPGAVALMHSAVSAEWVRRFAPGLGGFGAFWPGYPVAAPAADLAWSWPLAASLLDRKLAALRAHHSQTAHLFAALGEAFMRDMVAVEAFRDPWAGSGMAGHRVRERGAAAALPLLAGMPRLCRAAT